MEQFTHWGEKKFKRIKATINRHKAKNFQLELISGHDESIGDKWESWKYEKQLKIHADSHLAMLNTSKLGLELLINKCAYLAVSYIGHSYFDWYSTTDSIELIIRNMARND